MVDTSLQLKKGEIFSLLGPSGCGKTTILRILAGFLEPDTGEVYHNGKRMTHMPPNKRPFNTIFQNYALFPHLSLYENIAFGPRMAGSSRKVTEEKVEGMLELIQMTEHAHKKPTEISGGQKQRVAIARALVNDPQLLLLDEPLAALDLKLRQRMLLELDRIHDEVGTTFLYVTHDQGEAMSLSDRIAVMNSGRIEQIGTPAEIYEAPKSRFVADFIGDTNIFSGHVRERLPENYLRLELSGLGNVVAWNDQGLKESDALHLSIRPEKITIGREPPEANPAVNRIPAVVEDVIYLGSQTKFRARAGGALISVLQQHRKFLLDEKPITWEEKVWLSWHSDDGYMILEVG